MAAFVARRTFTTLKSVASTRCITQAFVQNRQFSFSKCLLNRLYTETHEWILVEGQIGTVGISNYAQEQLGEIAYAETPEVGKELAAEEFAGILESVKAASDVLSPAGGVVKEVNEALSENPSLINQDPLDQGWMYKMKVDEGSDLSRLMNEAAYTKYLETLEH